MQKFIFLILWSLMLNPGFTQIQVQSDEKSPVNQAVIDRVTEGLLKKHGDEYRFRAERGVNQTAGLWRKTDGDNEAFARFVDEHFIADSAELALVFDRIASNFEFLFGYLDRISIELNRQVHEDKGPVHKTDQYFSAYNPSSHVLEDLFQNKIAFIILLNFPNYSLKEKNNLGAVWSDRQWGYARLGDVFTSRVPPAVLQNMSMIASEGDLYISEYNIFAGQLVDKKGNKRFPEDMKLLSHWNIRDEIKANYGRPDGLPKQDMLYQVMLRIIDQSIPQQVINNSEYQWDPFENTLQRNGNQVVVNPENNVRYEHLLAHFKAIRKFDPFYPGMNTYIKRTFESGMEIPKNEVETLFREYASSPLIRETGKLISKRLGRPLKPFDLWYDGFTARSIIPGEQLDQLTKSLYPDAVSFDQALPEILKKIGFDNETVGFLAGEIDVDDARGSGHAMPSSMKEMPSHLRTRVGGDGMDYKGYNIAVHELGHNVEQTFSLHEVENYMMRGVPNNAFTEALAFMFQARDLELLGLDSDDQLKTSLDVLDIFWDNYEMMGVSMVDMEVWEWLYANPEATPEELRMAVLGISKKVWNEYYADVFGVRDVTVLSIYSHMIVYPLYLMSYPYGRLIMFQLEEYYKGKNFGDETRKIFSIGKKTPGLWMLEATGGRISNRAIFEAVKNALEKVGKAK